MKKIVSLVSMCLFAGMGWCEDVGSVELSPVVIGQESEGVLRVPVIFSCASESRRTITWETMDGTAKVGVDVADSNGTFNFANSSETVGFFDVRLVQDEAKEEPKWFTVSITSTDGVAAGTTNQTTTVWILDGGSCPYASATNRVSGVARLENRDWSTLAASLANGTAAQAANGETAAVDWDTTQEPNGWQTFTDGETNRQVLVQNDVQYAIVGGRLSGSETWTSNKIYVVRNWVYVPDGCTLTIMTNTVVKFCEQTGISGSVVVKGCETEPVIWTSAKDDTIGGDTDFKVDTPAWGDYNVASVSDTGLAIRYTTLSSWGTASATALAVGAVSAGLVRVPVTISTSRTMPFFVNWRTTDGATSGQLSWNTSTEGTKFIEIPLKDDSSSFNLELYESQGINLSTSARQSEVAIYKDAALQTFNATSQVAMASARLENRDWSTLAASLANGMAAKSANGETAAADWDTTQEQNGWQTFTDGETNRQVLVQNDTQYEIVGGRLTGSETWTSNKIYVVRNWVYVPSGCTLTILTNTVVKFCEQTGISGSVVVKGRETEPVIWTSAKDDTIGGDMDFKPDTPAWGDYNVASVSDTGLAIRYTTLSSWGTASATALAVGAVSAGLVRVPVTISTTRTTPFFVNWRMTDGATSGQLSWNTYTEGTKFIEVSLKEDSPSFNLELYESQGINLSTSARQSEVAIYKDAALQTFNTTSQVAVASARLENRDWSTLAASLANGNAVKAANGETAAADWDTTQEPNGWQTFTDGETNRQVLVQNDTQYEIVGGRLTGSETWTSNKIYVVRNWVYVPSGCTLTIMTNTVVKFCEQTGISGNVVVKGCETEPVIWTSAKDDTIGGDTDFKTDTPVWGDYNVSSVSDTGLAIRYTTLSSWGTASATALVVGAVSAGLVRVPVTISTTRTTPFFVNWRTTDGATSGQLSWNTSTEGTKFIEVPLKDDSSSFNLELYESQGINLSTSARQSEVAIYKDAALQTFNDTSVGSVGSARLENRAWNTTGAALVNGTVDWSVNGETAASAWNTATTADGWAVFSDGVTNRSLLVRNDTHYAIVGGRLSGNATWTADKEYIVRNWVYVPSGCTLAIAENTVVKFCENTGISGSVVVAGSVANPVVLTAVADDTRGGDADMKSVTPIYGTYSVSSLTHTGCELRYATASGFPVVSSPSLVVGSKGSGVVRVPVSVSGSRTGTFSVSWQTTDLTARYGEDYTKRSGTVVWNGVSDGTKFVEIPLNASGATEKDEQFRFTLTGGTDMTISQTECTSIVDLYDSDRMNDGEYLGVVSSVSSPYASFKPAVFDFTESGNAHETELQAWLKEKGALTADLDGKDQSDIAVALQTAGDKLSVKGVPFWQEYIAGTDPTNETSVFTAKIEIVDGVPHVSWSPDLNNGEGREGVRSYKMLGKNDLADANWSEVSEGGEADYRFFKVEVTMP